MFGDLHTWGCGVMVNVPAQQRQNKWSARAEEGVVKLQEFKASAASDRAGQKDPPLDKSIFGNFGKYFILQ